MSELVFEPAPETAEEVTSRLLDDIQPELSDSPDVQNLFTGVAGEQARLDRVLHEFFRHLLPTEATDPGMLPAWEAMLGLPVSPVGVPVEQRRAVILANIQKINTGSGLAWEELMTLALNSSNWSYVEVSREYRITILLPDFNTFSAGQVLALARRITPAHLGISVALQHGGFIIGVSLIGDML